MKKSTLLCMATGLIGFTSVTQAADYSKYFSMEAKGFKRFSVSVGALHVMPQGKAQPFQVNTAIQDGTVSNVGEIQLSTVVNNLSEEDNSLTGNALTFVNRLNERYELGLLETLPANMSGRAKITGLEAWNNQGTGLEAEDVTTLGIMANYFFTDNLSFEMKAGIPPKVDLKGQGKIYAPFSAVATPIIAVDNIVDGLPISNITKGLIKAGLPSEIALPEMDLGRAIEITDLGAHGAAASARAWTPAFEFQYHFGKTGVNKFRPYVGIGMMYAYFNELEMNPQVEKDLIAAGHMIANIMQGQAGASLENRESSADPKVKLEATDAFAPVMTAGFTYDFNDKWFAVGSITYAHLKNETIITVSNAQLGTLITSKADIEVNPVLAYAGIGIRF